MVIDGAVTPKQKIPTGYSNHKKGNITDDILASCSTIEEAIQFFEEKKIALNNAHILLGDRSGNAVIIEWVNGLKQIVKIKNNRLIATNFILSDTQQAAANCWRYDAINKGLNELETNDSIDFKMVGNVIAKAVQVAQTDSSGKVGGTLYTTL